MKRICGGIFLLLTGISLLLSGAAFADELKMGFAFSKPPFVFATSEFPEKFTDVRQQGLGIEIDLVKAALKLSGHTFRPVYYSYSRLARQLETGHIDTAVTVRPELPNRFYSEPFIAFHNFAITKSEHNIKIGTVDDLRGKSIIAWQGARYDLGKAFERAVQDNDHYSESADQEFQCLSFFRDAKQVVIIDRTIFKWYQKKLADRFDTRSPVVWHDLFPQETVFTVGFTSEKMRDDFNKGLATIREQGIYDRTISEYVD